jgi:hypothetical protein
MPLKERNNGKMTSQRASIELPEATIREFLIVQQEGFQKIF